MCLQSHVSACARVCTRLPIIFLRTQVLRSERDRRRSRRSFPLRSKQKQLLRLIKSLRHLRQLLSHESSGVISFYAALRQKMGLDQPQTVRFGPQRLGIWVQGRCQRGRGTDKAAHPRGLRLTLGHRGCLALWLTDVSLVWQELRFWKKLHHTPLYTAIIFSV